LWVGGVALLAVAIWRVRAPFARMGELDRLAENARKYDSWRGVRSAGRDDETTGADVMRALLRRQVLTWVLAGGLGISLIVAGFAIR
jgi:hypothetical protein